MLKLYTPLHAAAASGNTSVAQLLLESGAEVDARNAHGNSPLHTACLNGHVTTCVALASTWHANINATNERGQVILFYLT